MRAGPARELKRLAIGEAGWGPALVVAGVAIVVAFISIAGARLLVSADNIATGEALRQVPVLDAGLVVSANPPAAPVSGRLSAARIGRIGRLLAAALPRRGDFLARQSWGGVLMPTVIVANPAPSVVTIRPPSMQVAYRTGLASRCVVVAGSLPGKAGPIVRGSGGAPVSVTLRVAVTRATAAKFRLRLGSVLDLEPASTGDPSVKLDVTGIVRPIAPGSSFWQAVNSLRAPALEPVTGSNVPDAVYWLGGAFVGPGEINALGTAYQTSDEDATWFLPIRASLTAAEVPRLESAMASYASSPVALNAETAVTGGELPGTSISAGLAQGLAAFTAQWHSVEKTDSLLLVGLFAAGAMLLFICSALAIEAYRSELILLRVRGGSLRQLARRMLTRSCLLAVLALATGSALAVVVLPGSGSTTSWVLGAAAALVAIAGLPVLAVLAHRERRLADLNRRDELVVARPRLRRLAGELAIVVVGVAAIADLRLRGAGTDSTASYLSVSAVLVAAVVGLIVNRAYRGPLRAAARAAGIMKGPVGVVGLTRAALARTSSVGPAFTLMLTLTLVSFTGMVVAAISAGQVAASWAQVGADVQISAPGLTNFRLTGVTAGELHALGQVSGVRNATSLYTVPSTSILAVELTTAGHAGPPIGLAVVTPASYAAVAADTPWPDFPATAMAKPRTGTNGVVPVLVTPDVAARAEAHEGSAGGSFLQVGGLSLAVRIIGTITDTAAMPAGGSYLVLPRWAAYRLPSIPAPDTVLLVGSAIDLPQLQAKIARLWPSGTAVSERSQVLSQLVRSPAQHLSSRLYVTGALAAAVLSVLAVLFALASSARSRNAMMTELAALGMARSQALALGLTDALPLLAVAAIGSAVSGWLLAVILGPLLGLDVFTNGSVPVTLKPTWAAVLIPIAAAAAIAVAFLVVEGLAGGRRHIGTLLRLAEASQT
jgi:putative ABC transport system permease protein